MISVFFKLINSINLFVLLLQNSVLLENRKMSDYMAQANFDVLWDGFADPDDVISADASFLERFGICPSDCDDNSTPEYANNLDSRSRSISLEKDVTCSNSQEFQNLSNADVVKYIEDQENQNTAKKTLLDIKKFERFLLTKGEKRMFHTIEPEQLDEYIANFVLSAKKNDGNDYEPCSLRNIISSLDRKLKRAKYPYSIFRDNGPAFQLTRDALKAKQKSLKKMGRGNRPNCAAPITDEEINILYKKDLLGDANPEALLNTMWLNNTIHFGLRGVKENHNLKWGDITLQETSTGCKYLELNERQTKTRTGENINDVRSVKPKMFSNPQDAAQDPVRMYEVYASRRPIGYSEPLDPFYIAPRTVPLSSSGDQWFLRNPVGEKKIAGLMKTMAIKGQLNNSKRLTNHSARKHLVQKLRNAGVAPTTIMQMSGHRNIQSVLNYSQMSEGEQMTCSNLLSNVSSSAAAPIHHQQTPLAPTASPSSECIQFPHVAANIPSNQRLADTPATVQSGMGPEIENNQNQANVNLKNNDLQSIFAGATVNITNFNLNFK